LLDNKKDNLKVALEELILIFSAEFKDCKKLNGPLLSLIWEFAFPIDQKVYFIFLKIKNTFYIKINYN
jgi:hypothetical protein